MTTTTITARKPAASIKEVRNALNLVCTGRGKETRQVAFLQIAATAYAEGTSRVQLIQHIRTALGAKPDAADIAVARSEFIIGRAASRVAKADVPKGCEGADRLTFMRELVERYASPAKPGVKSTLRKGQTGRRTESQHKVIRAAEEAWSQVKAELGLGAAQTQAERNAKKAAPRAPQMPGASAGTPSATPTHAQLVTPAKATTGDEAVNHIVTQAASLLAFCNKNAKVTPTGFSMAVIAFKKAIDKEAALRASINA